MAKVNAKRTTPRRQTRKAASNRSTLARIEHELPERLEEFLKRAQRRLDELEHDVYRAGNKVRREGIRVLREVSHELGKIEQRGEVEWRRLRTRYGREAVKVLQRIEKAVAPPARKTVAKKHIARNVRAGTRA